MLDRLTIERMAAEAGDSPILIALSGGGDSTALLHLLAEEFGAVRLRAAVADHALREGSAQDAQRALTFARALGVSGNVLTITWPNGPQRAQQDAREARYAVLCDHARTLGARVIAVAHNADDQAETVMMRMAAKSGERGLAGMSAFTPAPLWPEGRGVWVARPLLGVRRKALRAYLRECGAEWIEDPANTNTAFERVRLRQRLAEQEAANGYQLAPLLDVTRDLRERADRLDADARALVEAAAHFEADTITIERKHWRGSSEVRKRALSALIAAAAGAARERAFRAVARLLAKLDDPAFPGATLGGAALWRKGDNIFINRDRGALSGRAGVTAMAPLALEAGVEQVWDGRLAITTSDPGWSIVVEDGAPTLRRGDERRIVSEAGARWLLTERSAHALGAIAHPILIAAPATLSPRINDTA